MSAGSARIGYIYAYDTTNNQGNTPNGNPGSCGNHDNNFNTLVADIESERNELAE